MIVSRRSSFALLSGTIRALWVIPFMPGAGSATAALSDAPISARADTPATKAVIVFRYDDVGVYSAEADPRTFAVDQAVFAAFAQRGLPLVAGVVPCSDSSDDVRTTPAAGWLSAEQPEGQWLLDRFRDQRVEIAQHGVTHQRVATEVRSEFLGIPLEIQRQRILAGKLRLEQMFNRPVETFIPPWNSYDQNTLDVLQQLGFTCLSDDWRSAAYRPEICQFPQTATLHHTITLLDHYRAFPPGSMIVVLFHSYDFLDAGNASAGIDIKLLERALDRVAVRDDLEAHTMSEIAEAWGPAYTRARHDAAQRFVASSAFLQSFPGMSTLCEERRPGALFPVAYYAVENRYLVWLTVAIFVSLLVVGGIVAAGAARAVRSAAPGQSVRALWILGLVIPLLPVLYLIIRIDRNGSIGIRSTGACAFGLGFGALCFVLHLRGRHGAAKTSRMASLCNSSDGLA